MKLKCLTEDGVQYLKVNFEEHFPYYMRGDGEYFQRLIAEHEFLQETGYEVPSFARELRVTGDDAADDAHNAQVLHRALRHLPLFLMMEERIWVCMLHEELFPFVCERRARVFRPEVADYKNKIYNSFFTYTKNGKRRGTFVNWVASLFWGAQMVYDAQNRQNPYALLEEIAATGFPSTMLLFSSSRILGRHETCLGLLKIVRDLRGQGYTVKRNDVVAGIKYLNLIAGLSILDMKSEQEIRDLLRNFYRRYYCQRA